jgi:glutamate-1-semialdehyde 2,1-aminomutase
MSDRYSKSEELLKRAEKVIPLGSQTFSKSKTQYPFGISPYFIDHAQGSHVWDVDGNEYIDFVCSLSSIILGHGDSEVLGAVEAQLKKGTLFSLPHKLEIDCAEKIVETFDCAEMVRFGKNGSDATAGAVRVARAFTSRDHVAVCGYHGWQDWYIGSTSRSKGVPQASQQLTHHFTYNDLSTLEAIFAEYPDAVAAVIMEPMTFEEPKDDFLHKVKDLCASKGAVFIFDEMVTGCRFARGGAQEYFGVTPDLMTLGKALSNGFPLSAVAGKAEIMKLMEEVFYSFTYGGETLSLAACLATLNKCEKENVSDYLITQGEVVMLGVEKRLEKFALKEVVSISGHPSFSLLSFKDTEIYSSWELKTYFLQEMFSRGVLMLGVHNMNYSHSDEDISKLLGVYDEVFPLLRKVLDEKNLDAVLKADVLQPLFKIR